MHDWSEKDFDWEGINDAAEFIAEKLEAHSEGWVSTYKEKWGTACVYCYGPHDKKAEEVYRDTYKQAIAKWPHLKTEILYGADWDEYLEGL